jgi:hypothetical protein
MISKTILLQPVFTRLVSRYTTHSAHRTWRYGVEIPREVFNLAAVFALSRRRRHALCVVFNCGF